MTPNQLTPNPLTQNQLTQNQAAQSGLAINYSTDQQEQGRAGDSSSASLPVPNAGVDRSPGTGLNFNPKMFVFVWLSGILIFIMHELSHLKRKDLAVNWIIVAMQILHWFNPVMWYAFYRMRQDCEIACDAVALSYLRPEERKKYGETIISLLTTMSEARWVPGTTGMVSGKSQIKNRITMIKLFNRKSMLWTVIAALLTALVGCAGLTGASKSTVYRVPISSKNLYSIDLMKDWKAIQQKAGIPVGTRIEDFETEYNDDGGIRELSYEVTGYKGGKLTHYRIEMLPVKNVYQITQTYVNQWLQYDQLIETESLVKMLNELNFQDLKPAGKFSWYVLRSSAIKDNHGAGDVRKFFVKPLPPSLSLRGGSFLVH